MSAVRTYRPTSIRFGHMADPDPSGFCKDCGREVRAYALGTWRHKVLTSARSGRPEADRFWEQVDRRGPDECWPWIRSLTNGYGNFMLSSQRRVNAHRWSYETLVGPIPEGLTIDHLCRNRACQNPAHMEPVTNAENVRRGISPAARNAVKTHCVRGHEYTEANTIRTKKGRQCRVCTHAWDRARWPRRKKAA